MQMEGNREERGRMQCFMKKEDKSLIDVEIDQLITSITVLFSPHWPPICYSFVSSISKTEMHG